MSIKSKLIASSLIEFVVVAVMIAGILLAASHASRNENIVRSSLIRLADSLKVARSVSRQLEEAHRLAQSGQAPGESYENARAAAKSSFTQWKQALSKPVAQPHGQPDIQENNLRDEATLEKQYAAMDRKLDSYLAGAPASGVETTVENVESVNDEYEASLLPLLETAIGREESGAARADRDAESATRFAAVFPLVISPIGLFIVMGISIVLIRDITGSIGKLRSATERVRQGDLDVSVDTGKRDELGELAESFNRMAIELKASTEELKRVNTELEGYAHTVSHDLKGPLSTLMIACSMLKNEASPEEEDKEINRDELAEIASIIERSARRSIDLIENLLALAEAGQVLEDVSEVDVSSVVHRIQTERATDIMSKGIKVELDEDLGRVRANPTHVYQVFANLIGNAIKYGDSDEPVISVSYLGQGESDSYKYSIKDNGPGIPPDALSRVFEPFYKGRGGGTGIGLAIVQKIVQLYGGEITVTNDGGARFDFSFGGMPVAQ